MEKLTCDVSPRMRWGEHFKEVGVKDILQSLPKQAPYLDAQKSPFAARIVLPPLAPSQKARAEAKDEHAAFNSIGRRPPTCTMRRSVSLPTATKKALTPLTGIAAQVSPSVCLKPRRRASLPLFCKTKTDAMPDFTSTPSTAVGSSSVVSTAASLILSELDTIDDWTSAFPASFSAESSSSTAERSATSGSLSWRLGDLIGGGSYGNVYQAQCRSTGSIFAVKVSHSKPEKGSKLDGQMKEELNILKTLRHRHIVAYLGHDILDDRLHIYLEYMKGGSLRNMVNEFGPLGTPLLQKATRGMLKGLKYLHNHDPIVVHRDLKGANVLVDDEFHVKLADFGCARCNPMSQSFSTVGSIHWIAPEVLRQAGHGRKADIWSLACVVIEIATASDPWGPDAFDNMMQAMFMIASSERVPPIPETLPDAARSFLLRCLQRSPDDRPCAAELLHHPFLHREQR